MLQKSEILFKQALSYIPGGVNSPVRAFNGVGGTPFFVQKGEGAYLFDIDGNSYIDYVCSWGPLILGHAHPSVTASIKKAIDQGIGFGTPTPIEIEMAELITKLVPSIEKIRMVNSGTEATMSAIRLARGYTGRNKIIKFRGCYHGHNDALLVKAGSGALTCGIPDSAGVPHDFVKHTLISEYNDINEVKNLFEHYGDDIAAIIVEPIAGNMNFVLPKENFLQGLRQLCDQYHSVLIFDEVMTGFRVALGGAQSYYNIKPDLTTLGKIIGGGLPVGAFGGKKEIMDKLAPQGPVYQAGTLSGNPVALAAGLATLKLIMEPNFYLHLEKHTNQLLSGMQHLADKMGIPFFTQYLGGMFGFYFTEKRTLENYKDVQICDKEKFQKFFHLMLSLGVYFAPSAYEAGFISAAHTEEEIQSTLLAVEKAFSALQQD